METHIMWLLFQVRERENIKKPSTQKTKKEKTQKNNCATLVKEGNNRM